MWVRKSAQENAFEALRIISLAVLMRNQQVHLCSRALTRAQPGLARPEAPGPGMDSRLAYSIAEACAAAGIRRTTLYNLIRSGKLRAIKCGGRTLILPDDLRRWLEGLPPLPAASPSEPSVIVRGDSGPLTPTDE